MFKPAALSSYEHRGVRLCLVEMGVLCDYHSPPVSDSGWDPGYDNLQMHEKQRFVNSIIFIWFKNILWLLLIYIIVEQIAFQLPCLPSHLISEFIPKKESQLTGCSVVAFKK